MGNCFKTREIDMIEVFVDVVDKYENDKLISNEDIKIDDEINYGSGEYPKKIKERMCNCIHCKNNIFDPILYRPY